jgi:hypothetical protein
MDYQTKQSPVCLEHEEKQMAKFASQALMAGDIKGAQKLAVESLQIRVTLAQRAIERLQGSNGHSNGRAHMESFAIPAVEPAL